MSHSPIGQPPPGTDLSADHPLDISPVIATYAIAVIAVGLRFYTRCRVQGVRILADDWMIVLALLSVTAGFAMVVIANENPSIGRHVWTVPQVQVEDMMRILFIFVTLYVISAPLIKLSIILFYRRIFGMTYSIWFCVFLSVGYFVSGIIAFMVCCRPVSYYWTQFTHPDGGKCVYSMYNFYISYAAVNVATDVAILLVPMPIVWKLQMRRTQKLLVCGILLIGGFVCVASLVRIYYITFLKSEDYTWVIGKVFTWSSIEPCIGILCACLPTLHPLIRATMSRVFGTSSARYVASRNQEATNKKTFIRRQRPLDWDETLLTTHDIQVEMSGVRRDHHTEEGHITVDMEFQIVEESNQLSKR